MRCLGICSVLIFALSAIVVQIGSVCIQPSCPPNEQYLNCVSSACQDLPCYQSPPFYCPPDCTSRCFCLPGFERNQLGKCVQCPPFSQTCPPNEVWTDCVTPCLSDYCNKTDVGCAQVCRGSGCVCQPGLRRNQDGVCVKC